LLLVGVGVPLAMGMWGKAVKLRYLVVDLFQATMAMEHLQLCVEVEAVVSSPLVAMTQCFRSMVEAVLGFAKVVMVERVLHTRVVALVVVQHLTITRIVQQRVVLEVDTVVGVGRNSHYCHTLCTPGLEVDPTIMVLQHGTHPPPGMEVGSPA